MDSVVLMVLQNQPKQQRQRLGEFGGTYGVAEPAERKREAIGQVRTLITIAPASINSVQANGWEEVDLVVDSGASETVIWTRNDPVSRPEDWKRIQARTRV